MASVMTISSGFFCVLRYGKETSAYVLNGSISGGVKWVEHVHFIHRLSAGSDVREDIGKTLGGHVEEDAEDRWCREETEIMRRLYVND